MKKRLISALLLLAMSTNAFAGSPAIFKGSFLKNLAAAGIEISNSSTKQILDVAVDPRAGAGVAATQGSVAMGAGLFFVKFGPLNTDWIEVEATGLDWLLAGNAGTNPATNFLGTTDAQDLVVKANNVEMIRFLASKGWTSTLDEVPADGVSKNEYDQRVFISPVASTTTANHTGYNYELIYDNANSGFNFGGNLIGGTAGISFNGSGTANYLAGLNVYASGNNGSGTSSSITALNANTFLATGHTSPDVKGVAVDFTTNGGILTNVNTLNLNTNVQNSPASNIDTLNINSTVSGTSALSGTYFGTNLNTQLNDSSTVAGNVFGINNGLSLNNSASTASGVYGQSTNVQLNNTASTTGVTAGSLSINCTDTTTCGNIQGNSLNTIVQSGATAGGITQFSGYGEVKDTATASSLGGADITSRVSGSAVVSNLYGGRVSADAQNAAGVTNHDGFQINTSNQNTSTVDNVRGLQVNMQVSDTATINNQLNIAQMNATSSGPTVPQITGLSIDLGSISLSPASLAAGGQKKALTFNDGAIEGGYNYSVPSAAAFFQQHYIGGSAVVESGAPTAAYGFGTNLAQSVVLHDDWTVDGTGLRLGYVDVGFVGSINIDAGKTLDSWTGALGGAGNPAGAGTIDQAIMFRAAGILPQGGAVTVNNSYGFATTPTLCIVATNCWGLYIGDTLAENYMPRLALGTATFKVTTGVMLDVNGISRFQQYTRGDSAADAATGANQTLTAPTTPIVRLTSGTLTSVDMIPAGADGQSLTLMNATGVAVTINNETGGTAANRILTGTGSNYTFPDNGTILITYDGTAARWKITGAPVPPSGRYVSTFSGTSITPQPGYTEQTWLYNGGSAQTFSTTGFGTISGLVDGTRITIVGSSDTNTLTIDNSDIADGRLQNGYVVLGKADSITYEYNSTLARMFEVGRNL